MKFACGVVLYKPGKNNISHLKTLKPFFDLFMAFDNTEKSVDENFFDKYFFTGKNEGLAVPYNKFIMYCKKNEIDFLCILDQDTLMNYQDIIKMKEYIMSNRTARTIIYAPRLKGSYDMNWVINSNSFIDVNNFYYNDLKYDEYYFIDRLDADLCMQINNKNLDIKINENVIVKHRIGDGAKKEHSFKRHYYIFRNRLYFNRKWSKGYICTILQIIKHFIIIINERQSLMKIKSCLDALVDDIKYRYKIR